jgi:poly(3-hydroxybutyrate) depolymerase
MMAFTTFQGPLRAGTAKEGIARNTGLVVLSQSYDSGDLTGAVIGNIDVNPINLPQGAQIVDIVHDQVVAAATGTTTVSVGNASGGGQLAAAVATTAGGRFRGTATAATQLAWQTSTTADTPVWIRIAVGTGTLTAGRVITTIMYVQRAPDGAQNPASV